jgi:hypothetical protein
MIALAMWLVSAAIVGYAAVVACYVAVALAFAPFLVLGFLLVPFAALVEQLKEGHRERIETRGRFFAPLPRTAASARSLAPPPYRGA